ncbi:MAG: hypothetical protein EZS28_013215 [Streblomastix strix]|uniref:Uncharacterized protein n=1 Tax=Streblomastix strix TaxID=222440 RepID=A0A5J4W8R6_9EUKA|nr:MAG: hypothetical protein EZS28_013215 [Streblomastix strix]
MWLNESSFEEWKKNRKNPRQQKWVGVEDINGDKFTKFVVRDNKGFIQSSDGLRITVPIKLQKVNKYSTKDPTKQDRATTCYKAWKKEDKLADNYRHFIKKYQSPFLKMSGYIVAQVHSMIGGRIWKGIIAPCESEQGDNKMMKLIQVGYAALWNGELGEIPEDTNDDEDEIFTIPTVQAIQKAKYRRDEKILKEQRSFEYDITKNKSKEKTYIQ